MCCWQWAGRNPSSGCLLAEWVSWSWVNLAFLAGSSAVDLSQTEGVLAVLSEAFSGRASSLGSLVSCSMLTSGTPFLEAVLSSEAVRPCLREQVSLALNPRL